MEIVGIDHVGIVTGNLEKSSAFYTRCFGFTPGVIEKAEELKLRLCHLRKGEDTIELLEPENKEVATLGLRHIAFKCKDIDNVFEEAKREDLMLLHKTPAQYKDLKFFFCKAPDGVLIEFIEEKE